MAASTAAQKILTTGVLPGYMAAYFPEKLNLLQTGALRLDTNPIFTTGNTHTRKGRVYDLTADQTPTAATDLTVNALSSYSLTSPIIRRAQSYGNEDLASVAGGEDVDALARDIAANLAHNQAYWTEYRLFKYVVPAIFGSGGILNATHVVNESDAVFDYTMVAAALKLMGENFGLLNTLIMHSTVYHGAQISTMLTAQPAYDAIPDYRSQAVTYQGNIGNMRVFINDRVYETGGVYDTIVCAPGTMFAATQIAGQIEYERKATLAAGTDVWINRYAHALGVEGVTYAGAAGTTIGGITDATLQATASWAKITGHVASQTPLVVIKSLAGPSV
jgi:hypothetical protein